MNLNNWSLDGIKYNNTETVPIGCDDCSGCDICCHEMGDTIIQDPYDLWNFTSHMKLAGGAPITFEILISEDGPWELSEHDGLLLPNLKMVDDGRCSFLNNNGRCQIHQIRSGLCRLYPLARVFEDSEDGSTSLSYIILNQELGCKKIKGSGDDIKITKWLGINDIKRYEDFQIKWRNIKSNIKEYAKEADANSMNYVQQKFLRLFYARPYTGDFFTDFNNRILEW